MLTTAIPIRNASSKNIAAICGRNVDGVIWEPATPDSLAYASQFPESTPLLAIGPNGGDQSLLLPYKEAAYKLTSELIERGHQHIACLMTKGRRTQDFLEGFRSCLFDHQLPYSDDLSTTTSTTRCPAKSEAGTSPDLSPRITGEHSSSRR